MIRQKQPTPPLHLATPSPETSPRSSTTVSDWDADDEGTMSAEDLVPSRPLSVAVPDVEMATSDLYHIPSRPTLADVLSNSAPHPWTLSAFTAYLSQNHCLENLEFTMDAERYRERYDEMLAQTARMLPGSDFEEVRYVRMLWQRLTDAYIVADGAREINIPSHVRDTLLSLPNHITPPEPDVLKPAVEIIYKLMEESVLVSFLNEVPSSTGAPSYGEQSEESKGNLKRRGSSKERRMKRSRSRRRASPQSSSHDIPYNLHTGSSTRLPATSSLNTGLSRGTRAPSHLSSGSGDTSLTDDSVSPSSPSGEPMTPPTTPPSSDIGGGSSPRGRSDLTWKKMLGWKKKSSSGMRDNRFPTVGD